MRITKEIVRDINANLAERDANEDRDLILSDPEYIRERDRVMRRCKRLLDELCRPEHNGRYSVKIGPGISTVGIL